MNKAYTYKLVWSTPYGNYFYYGVRSANKVPASEDLWKVYFTSSRIVPMFRSAFGDPEASITRQFDSTKEALDWETKVLTKLRASAHSQYVNQHNGGPDFGNFGGPGRKHTLESREKMSMQRKGRGTMLGKRHSAETIERMSKSAMGQVVSPETRRKLSLIGLSPDNPSRGVPRTTEIRDKISKSKRGVNHPRYSGDYVTPWGVFSSPLEMSLEVVEGRDTLIRWCRDAEKAVNHQSLGKSHYLRSLKECPIGKTYRALGFYFIPKG